MSVKAGLGYQDPYSIVSLIHCVTGLKQAFGYYGISLAGWYVESQAYLLRLDQLGEYTMN